ncbi:hypothetical protein GH714_017432 [Hevea brasiliensis]|uniref:Mannosyl-oligosaccharide glucosidase n=1 Tax=Hevea brasiliensis TaxID=3981 RepID=A0A6A6KEE5_HEVBR|nr:hypothetical protein GH714_017432 [Hevea brasiliensis]
MAGSGRSSARSRIKFSTDSGDDGALRGAKPNSKLRRDRSKDHSLIRILNVDLKIMLGIGVFSFSIIIFLIHNLVRPLNKLRRLGGFIFLKFQGEHKESLYWGTYRPHVYLGIRARTPQSLVAGLMWIGLKDGRYYMRHLCQDSDELSTYGWTQHNGRDFGHQVLVDQGLKLETSFLKSKNEGSGYGGDWAVRIDAQSEKTLIFTIYLICPANSWGPSMVRKFGLQLPDSSEDSSNILVFQISARIPFKTDIVFVSGTGVEDSRVKARVNSLTGTILTNQLQEKQSEFDAKFDQCFNIAGKLESESRIVGKVAIANMLGGIGYFYGQSKIAYAGKSKHKDHDNFIAYWPAELYTAVPSRPFFPRGFLWDEGFHQLLIWRWDISICLDIVGHWLDLMNIDGWIPREQILGSEALSKVPEEFVRQRPTNGNPPTLFLVISDLLHGIQKNKFTSSESNKIISFLERAFVRLDAWFQWFNTTQSGKEIGSYFWHGRDNSTTRELNPKTLSSGLDDYPRASHPSEEERHLDLRCWMLLTANCMHSITQLLKKEYISGKDYGLTAKLLSNFEMLNQMHLDPAYGAYFDFGNHTDKVRLSWKETIVENSYVKRELVREVLERPELRLIPHVGYVSLFPFMEKIIHLSLYMKRNTEHDPPYWRGPIWMNLNYRILSALYHYSKEDGPYKDRAKAIYEDLRSNLIRNVVQNYHQTGFLWEQYDQKKGKGKGARLFTGWTSLVLLVMAEAYC